MQKTATLLLLSLFITQSLFSEENPNLMEAKGWANRESGIALFLSAPFIAFVIGPSLNITAHLIGFELSSYYYNRSDLSETQQERLSTQCSDGAMIAGFSLHGLCFITGALFLTAGLVRKHRANRLIRKAKKLRKKNISAQATYNPIKRALNLGCKLSF